MRRRDFLLGSAGLAALPAVAAPLNSDRRLIVVFASGGWDVSYTIDPKPDSPWVDGPELHEDPEDPDDREILRSFGDLQLYTNAAKRPSVTTFFERHAASATVVNGIFVGSIGHRSNRVRILTGTADESRPDLASIAGHVLGADLPLGCIDLGNQAFKGTLASSVGTLGFRGQLIGLVDPDRAIAGTADDPASRPSPAARSAARSWASRRIGAERARHELQPRRAAMLDDLDRSLERSARFRHEGAPALQGWRTAAPSFQERLEVGLELLVANQCRTLLVDTGEQWDTHVDNVNQHGSFERTFAALTWLADTLQTRGLASSTTVVVLSEMARTPRLNERLGKDHWQHTSALLFGAGVPGGRVLGATDETLASMPLELTTGAPHPSGQLLTTSRFAAGVLASLDVDPGAWFPGVEPFTALCG